MHAHTRVIDSAPSFAAVFAKESWSYPDYMALAPTVPFTFNE